MYKEVEIINAINRFEILIRDYPDDPKSTFAFKNFIKYFITIKPTCSNLPTSEVMAILKKEKPNIFYSLRKQASNTNYLYFLTNIEMNYDVAIDRIQKFKEMNQAH